MRDKELCPPNGSTTRLVISLPAVRRAGRALVFNQTGEPAPVVPFGGRDTVIDVFLGRRRAKDKQRADKEGRV